jgi:hypothetical protein
MQYYTDGLDSLIRVDTDAPPSSQEFFLARAEALDDDGTWCEQGHLTSEILNSGYYRSATADEVARIISEAIPVPAFTRTFSSTATTNRDYSVVGSGTLVSV